MSEVAEKHIKDTELDTKWKYEVTKMLGVERLLRCYQCGTCTASCPVSRFNYAYGPRRIIRMIQLGLKDRLLRHNLDLVWLCSYCYLCEERCPQDVRFPEVVTALRNMAVETGRIHPSYTKLATLVAEQGRIYDVDDFMNMRRKRLGLPPIQIDKTVWNVVGQLLRLKK